MATAVDHGNGQALRVAAVWGTTVVALKVLSRGESFELGESELAVLPIPDGIEMAQIPLRGQAGGWDVDARGVQGGLLRLRGRDEDPASVGRGGVPIPVVPGDFGLLQYGTFAIFFQYTAAPQPIAAGFGLELLIVLALFSSAILHVGVLGLVRALMTPPPINKPLELTNPEEYAERFGLHRPLEETPPPPEAGDKAGGSGVKDPGAHDKKPQGGGRKVAGAEGKFGKQGPNDKTEIPGDIKPATHFEGLSEVLSSDEGKEIQHTLKTIDTVANALSGINSANLVMGGGSGTGLKGGGAGGGGTGAGVPFGSGTLDTGWGFGKGGGYGAGGGGPGGAGSGGYGRGGSGGGSGTGNGGGGGAGGEHGVGIGGGAPTAHGGLSPEQVRRVVMAHTGALRACYETEASRNPNLHGGVTVAWKIQPDGSVLNPALAGTTMNNPRVEGCVVRQVRAWHFPTSDSATDVASYPFKFGVGN
jgi:hypothetical protein